MVQKFRFADERYEMCCKFIDFYSTIFLELTQFNLLINLQILKN